MGAHDVRPELDDRQIRAFSRAVLGDLRAFERMMELDMIESGVRRMGVEQELFLVDENLRPIPIAAQVLAALDNERYTTELARFNLEANLEPQALCGTFLSDLERELERTVAEVDRAAQEQGGTVLLAGILPTLRGSDLGLHNMSENPRYRALNDSLLHLRGDAFRVAIRGIDLLEATHDNVMLESANTSLQLHLQVDIESFPRLYNLAQVITAPLLAVAVNSPILLGRRLWHETRVALFEHSVDSRSHARIARGDRTRVSFGERWIRNSVLELWRDDATRFPVLLVAQVEGRGRDGVESGSAAELRAFTVHNGTVWRWNRPCYGIIDGVAHLRIENRVLPSGPTILDEVANAAFFYGLMVGLDHESHGLMDRMPFEDAKGNFLAAARDGLGAQMTWLDATRTSVRQLIADELLPKAHEGLASLGVPDRERERYLGVIRDRTATGQTGAQWTLSCYKALNRDSHALAATMLEQQRSGRPVHEWKCATRDASGAPGKYTTVAQLMTTDVRTVRPEDVVDMAVSLMDWEHVHHIPVEDTDGQIVGMVSNRGILTMHEEGDSSDEPTAVRDVMEPPPARVSPDTTVAEGMRRLLESQQSCLLVVDDRQLLGIVTEHDFLRAAAALLRHEE